MKAQQFAEKQRAAFPKSYRLTKTDEFSSVFGFRKAIRSTHFLLHYRLRKDEEATEARLGLVIPKRLLKRAVDRNLVRRLARESFRKMHCQLPARDLILRLMSKLGSLEKKALADEIRTVLAKTITPITPER